MEMEVWKWINQVVVEGIKYVILGHWFFGYEFSRKKTRYLLLLYPLLIPVVEYINIPELVYLYKNCLGLLLLQFLLKGKVFEKFKAFFLIWFLIAFVDLIIITPFLILDMVNEQDVYIKMCIGSISCFLWILLSWRAKKLQINLQIFWKALSFGEYIALLILLFFASLMLGGVQGYFYDAITDSEKEIVFLLGLTVIILFIIVCIWFFYTRQIKKRLEEMNRLNISYIKLQRKYYEDSLRQYEDMRSFRHDINNHIYMLSQLSQENKMDELKEYIAEMGHGYEKVRSIHTGNFIADCIISHTLGDLEKKENFSFQMDGHFPERLSIEDIDFCILLSNLLDNAKEALEKAEGRALLQIEVKTYRQKLFLVISNSVSEECIDFNYTSKPDETHHGYGLQNVRRVVEKYNGSVQWKQEQGMAVVVVMLESE